ncbi:MAG: hypothetical protein JWN24_5036 [Phycisphaerales bacterium]|nr:hypothetical protein [Phycisphaerales bacterium]
MRIFTRNRAFIPVVSLVFVVGVCAALLWSSNVNSQKPHIDLTRGVSFRVYDGGKIAHTGKASGDSPTVQELDKLVRDAAGKWKNSLVSYAPGLVFSGENFSITLQQNRMILNYSTETGKWAQTECDLAPGVYTELRKSIMAEEKGRAEERGSGVNQK